MSRRGHERALVALVSVVLLGAATSACDDSDRSPVEDPTPTVDGTPPGDRDSYEIAEVDLTTPTGAPATAADRVLRLGGSYVLLGHDTTEEEDGAVWISSDLATWKARGGWIAGYAGVQRVVGLVEYDGSWIGAYNESPSGLPPLAWHLATSDSGQNWDEAAMPSPTSQPSSATGVVAVGNSIVVAGSRTTGEADADSPITWRTRDGKKWTMTELASDDGRSVSPRQPFVIDERLFIPGASLTYEGDEIATAKPLLWRSDDAGKTFKRIALPSIGDRSVPLFGLHTDAVDLLFGWSGSDAVIWRSTDDGRTWQARPEDTLTNSPEGQSYPRRAVRDGDCVALAGVIGDLNADQPVPAAMWRTCDGGTSWSRMATDELDSADATETVDLIDDSGSLVLVTNSDDAGKLRLLRLTRSQD